MSTRIVRLATAIAALVGLIATGCSSPSSQATPTTTPAPTTTASIATETTTTDPVRPSVASTTVHRPAPTPAPAPAPAAPAPAPAPAPGPAPAPAPAPEPEAESGDPVVSVPDPFFIINPIDFGLFTPRVTSVTGPASFRCDDPAERRAAVRIRWTSINTEFVSVLIDGIGFFAGMEGSSSLWVILDCGSDHVVTVMARWPDLSPGLSMSTTIAYEAS